MATQAEIHKAVTRPWAVYRTPEEVLADGNLTDAQKRRVLESWEHDARELSVAEEENMGGGEPSMLDSVLEALATLPAGDERPRGPGTKHGAQPTPRSATDQDEQEGPTISGAEARQAEIVLKTPQRRWIFIGGLVLAAVAVVIAFYLAWPN